MLWVRNTLLNEQDRDTGRKIHRHRQLLLTHQVLYLQSLPQWTGYSPSVGASSRVTFILSALLSFGTCAQTAGTWSAVRNCSMHPTSYVTGHQPAMCTKLRDSNLSISVHLFKEMLVIFSLQSRNTFVTLYFKRNPKHKGLLHL